MEAREALEGWNLSLMGDSGGSLEDHKTDRNTKRRGPAHEVGERSNGSIRNRARGYLGSFLANNIILFCPCPENLSETEFKSNVWRRKF